MNKLYSIKFLRISVLIISIVSVIIAAFYIGCNVVPVSADASFEESIAGFPDSYKPYLRNLHELHPNWTFEPVNTGLDWNTVLSNEMVVSRNLVPLNIMALKGVTESNGKTWYPTPTSWKDFEMKGSFNWSNNSWAEFSGGGWAQASTEAVCYVMDPRNWLTENNIFEFETLTYNSAYQNKAIVETTLSGTFMANKIVSGTNKTYADVLIEVGAEYNVSPVFLASRLKQEKGNNNDVLGGGVVYDSSTGHYRAVEAGDTGTIYYNYFNINASGATRQNVLDNGGKEAKTNGWTTPYLAIKGGTEKIADKYIKSGRYSIYFQKFSVVNPTYYYMQYMQNLLAPINEGYTIKESYFDNGYSDYAFDFKIPVYENMPANACTRPKPEYSTANPNYKLGSITVTGTSMENTKSTLSLTPTFSTDTTSYSIVVPYKINKINVSATAYASTSTITGTGNYNLKVGDNKISITCTAEYGSSYKRTYTINVYRQSGSTYLTSINPGSGTFDSTFEKTKTTYNLYVNSLAESVELVYSKESSYAYVKLRHGDTTVVSSDGTATLSDLTEGLNEFYLDVSPSETDSVGKTSYKINVYKYSDTTYDLSEYQVSGTETNYAGEIRQINGFSQEMTVKQVIATIPVNNGSAKVLDKDTKEKKSDSLVGTGDYIYIYDKNGNVMQKLQVILYGDVNGDGKINIFDFGYMKVQFLKKNDTLKGIYLKAADLYTANGSGFDIFDMGVLKVFILKKTPIKQTR